MRCPQSKNNVLNAVQSKEYETMKQQDCREIKVFENRVARRNLDIFEKKQDIIRLIFLISDRILYVIIFNYIMNLRKKYI